MSESIVRLEAPRQSLSLAADFYNRYPGEQVMFFLQFAFMRAGLSQAES